ncbi:MAG: hypothetical protein WCL71_08920 [Deltaproteobacteria bacterium]
MKNYATLKLGCRYLSYLTPHSKIHPKTLLVSLCGNIANAVVTSHLSIGASKYLDFMGDIIEDTSEAPPSIRRSTCPPFSVEKKYFNASCVNAACFLFFRKRSSASMIVGS